MNLPITPIIPDAAEHAAARPATGNARQSEAGCGVVESALNSAFKCGALAALAAAMASIEFPALMRCSIQHMDKITYDLPKEHSKTHKCTQLAYRDEFPLPETLKGVRFGAQGRALRLRPLPYHRVRRKIA
jgi:hypothetical protein